MVRTKSRPTPRPKGAGPQRRPKRQSLQEEGHSARGARASRGTVDPRKYPNLAARQEMDRQLHVRAARRMGATRKQASRHASEEVGSH